MWLGTLVNPEGDVRGNRLFPTDFERLKIDALFQHRWQEVDFYTGMFTLNPFAKDKLGKSDGLSETAKVVKN